jgi:hypothetical protein
LTLCTSKKKFKILAEVLNVEEFSIPPLAIGNKDHAHTFSNVS